MPSRYYAASGRTHGFSGAVSSSRIHQMLLTVDLDFGAGVLREEHPGQESGLGCTARLTLVPSMEP